MKHASALVAVLSRNLTSATSKGTLQQAGMSTSLDSSAAAQSEVDDAQDDGNLHARHAHFIMILILMTLFILVTLSLTGAMLAFCRKKNTVFTNYDGVATTSGEAVGRSGGRVSIDGISELELGNLDADGEGMCGARDRGQCYYQLSDDNDDDDDNSDSSGNKSDEDDEKIRRNEQKKMLKSKTGSKRISHNRVGDNKKEVILEIQNDDKHFNSDNRVVRFATNNDLRKNRLTSMFNLFRRKGHVSPTKITSTITKGNGSYCNNNTLSTKSKTFPPASQVDMNSRLSIDSNFQNISKSKSERQQISSTEVGSTQLRGKAESYASTVKTSSSCNPNSPSDPSFSFYPSSRSKRRQLNGIGNANFKAAGRRRKNKTCVNPEHNHGRSYRENQKDHNVGNSRGNTPNRNDARILRHHQGQTYQARLYRRLQEQAVRLNRDGRMTSPTVSDYWACADGKHSPALYQMHELRRYLADPNRGSHRLQRCHSIHAIPQTGPESITDSAPPESEDLEDLGGGRVGSAQCSNGGDSSSKTFGRARGCRTSSKCGITIVRVEPSIDISDELGDRECSTKSKPNPFLEIQTSQEERILGIGNQKDKIPESKEKIKMSICENSRNCYDQYSDARTTLEDDKNFNDVYLLGDIADLKFKASCCETANNACFISPDKVCSPSPMPLSTDAVYDNHGEIDNSKNRLMCSTQLDKYACANTFEIGDSLLNLQAKSPTLHSDYLRSSNSEMNTPIDAHSLNDSNMEPLCFSANDDSGSALTHNTCKNCDELGLFLSCNDNHSNTVSAFPSLLRSDGTLSLEKSQPATPQHRYVSTAPPSPQPPHPPLPHAISSRRPPPLQSKLPLASTSSSIPPPSSSQLPQLPQPPLSLPSVLPTSPQLHLPPTTSSPPPILPPLLSPSLPPQLPPPPLPPTTSAGVASSSPNSNLFPGLQQAISPPPPPRPKVMIKSSLATMDLILNSKQQELSSQQRLLSSSKTATTKESAASPTESNVFSTHQQTSSPPPLPPRPLMGGTLPLDSNIAFSELLPLHKQNHQQQYAPMTQQLNQPLSFMASIPPPPKFNRRCKNSPRQEQQ